MLDKHVITPLMLAVVGGPCAFAVTDSAQSVVVPQKASTLPADAALLTPELSSASPSGCQAYGVGVDVSGAWYLPTHDLVHDLYGNFARWTLEFTLPAANGFAGWLGIGSIQSNGYSICDCDCTRLNLIPVIVGVQKSIQWGSWFRPYIALGALPTWTITQNYSPYVMQTNMDWSVGGIARIGVRFESCGFRIGIFGDYSYLRANLVPDCGCLPVCTNSANLSGWAVGGSIGYSF